MISRRSVGSLSAVKGLDWILMGMTKSARRQVCVCVCVQCALHDEDLRAAEEWFYTDK